MPEDRNHSRTGYVRGCRCQICVDANKEYQREYMRQWRNRKKSQKMTIVQEPVSVK